MFTEKFFKLMTYGGKTPHVAVAQPGHTIAHKNIDYSLKKMQTSEFLLENRMFMTCSKFIHINLKWF